MKSITLALLVIVVVLLSAVTMKWETSGVFLSSSFGIPIKPSLSSPSSSIEMQLPELQLRLRADHPVCFSPDLFEKDSDSLPGKSLDLEKVGVFVKIGRNVSSSIRYDHKCPAMKHRYNCAKNKTRMESSYQYGEHATHWKLNLRLAHDHSQTCNLWEFGNALGPVGLANHLLLDDSKGSSSTTTINIFIGGNSYLRQIFEALVCGFHDDITNHWLQHGSKFQVSLEAIAERKGKLIELDEIGTLETPLTASSGGHCQPAPSQYYEEGVELPLVCKKSSDSDAYNDNLGMVEFGEKIRFFYIFHPEYFQNATQVFRTKFDMDIGDIHWFIYNGGLGNQGFKKRNPKLAKVFEQNRTIKWPYSKFKALQRRDTGRWFGADNPWITSPPDIHACMRGVPDDEVNLLLFLLLNNGALVT